MARAITCWVCRGPHSKAKHRKARELRPARKASRRRAPSAGGAGPANALWKRVNAIIDRLGEHKLSDSTAPMKTGGFFSVRGKYALEFARALRMARIPFRQKLVGGSPTFYLTVAAPKSRRNPAAMDGHVFVVIAHGKNGEVAYRGREAHLTYGAAWREAQIVARRRGLTDVHIVKDGKDIVGEVRARTNPSAECRECGKGLDVEEREDARSHGYGRLCWGCDFEKHSGISDLHRDRAHGPPVFDGTWRRYDTRHELRAAYRRGSI